MTCFFSVGRCEYRLFVFGRQNREMQGYRSERSLALVLLGKFLKVTLCPNTRVALVIMGVSTFTQCFAAVNVQYVFERGDCSAQVWSDVILSKRFIDEILSNQAKK